MVKTGTTTQYSFVLIMVTTLSPDEFAHIRTHVVAVMKADTSALTCLPCSQFSA
jgi:hypothetical protein